MDVMVNIVAQGGDASAAQIRNVATATGELGKKAGEAGGHLKGLGKIEHIGVHLFSKELLSLVPGLEHVHGAAKLVTATFNTFKTTLGVLSGPIGWIVAAVGVLAAAFISHRAHTEKLAAEYRKLNKEHLDLIHGFDDATRAGGKLTDTQTAYLAALREIEGVERSHVLLQNKMLLAQSQSSEAVGSLTERFKVWLSTGLGPTGEHLKVASEITSKHTLETKRLAAEIEALEHGYSSVEEYVKSLTKSEADLTKKTQEQNKVFAENVKIINAMTREQADAAKTGTKGQSRWDAERASVRLWVHEQNAAVKAGENDWKAFEAIRKAGAAKMTAVDRQAAQATKEAWLSALGPILGAFENLGVGLLQSIGKGTQKAGEALEQFKNQAIQAMEAMLVKAIVLGIAFQVLGLGTFGQGATKALGFQFGGKVPGPEGEPKLAVVHGGETVSNPTGTGGGSGSGTTIVQNINVGGAFASLRQLQQAQRSGIRSRGDKGLA